MLRFRPRLAPPASPLAVLPDLLTVGQLIDELMQPGHFFVAPTLHLHWTGARTEDVPWEIFRGRLLDPSQTRRQARLLSWHVTAEDGNPMLSVRLDVHAGVVHVTRGILCYVWEAYDAGDNVIESREVQRWTTELVGSAELDRLSDIEELRDELVCLIWQAVVGTSKLPLHSVEAPLPAFTFGQLHYCYRPWAEDVAEPMSNWEILDAIPRNELSHRERARLFEALLRALSPGNVTMSAALIIAQRCAGIRPAGTVTALLRTMFNEVSLAPYTGLVDNVLALLRELAAADVLLPDEYADFLAHVLRRLCRHLTAYDLLTFHHRGANYPDGLLVEKLLRVYATVIQSDPLLLAGPDVHRSRLRRRALLHACLLHWYYDALLVPDQPTSPGENARVLPPSHVRVPEEQLLHPHRRQRRLFTDRLADWFDLPGYRAALSASLDDLRNPAERLELGIGLFIDRPLGYGKATVEPDYTPLLAHEAFSFSIARKRVKELAMLARELEIDVPAGLFEAADDRLQRMSVRGVPAAQLAEPGRPTAALADVRRVADDFVIVRTMPGGLREMLGYFDFGSLLERIGLPRVVAMVQSPRGPVIGFFDDEYQLRLEAVVDDSAGFVRRAGIELPVAGLRIVALDGEQIGAIGVRVKISA